MSSSPLIAPFRTGLELDLAPWQSPPDSFSDLNNFHVEHGFLERRNGYRYLAKNSANLTNGTAVTGISSYINQSSGTKTTLAWDTLSVYSYSKVSNSFTQLTNSSGGATSLFTGTSKDYFWTANWQSTSSASNTDRLYFTNGIPLTGSGATAQDGIWYYDGGSTVTSFVPYIATSPSTPNSIPIKGCKLIFSIGQRLVLLYTNEDGTLYPQRARWCAKQNPTEQTSGGVNGGWVDSVAGGGDYTDAATSDQIISAQFLQNQLIVFFTDSVWSLVATSDPNRAFRWQKINNFRSLQGKMASVQYDEYIGAVGSRGITATNGANTTRIDNTISTFTIDNMSQLNLDQTFCARDYNTRRWWTLYNDNSSSTNKTKALIRDDDSGAYSTYSIELNCLGYAVQGYSYKYEDFTAANGFASPDGGNILYKNFGKDATYNSYMFDASNESLVGGDYTGGIFVLESSNSDDGDPIEASFETAAWNPFYEEGKECVLSYVDIYITTLPITTAEISFYKNTDAYPYSTSTLDFLPQSVDYQNLIQNVSQANPANVTSSNHGLSTGNVIYIYGVQGMDDINSTTQATGYTITVIDENNFTLDGIDSTSFDAYTSGGAIYENEFNFTKMWKRVFAGGTGFQHRMSFSSSSDNQSIRIHGFKPTFKPRGRRLINQ